METTDKPRFRLFVAVHLLLIKDGKVLLLRRFNTGYEDGNYSVVAGYKKENELIEVAMVREAQEEAGLEISVENVRIIGIMHRKPREEHIDFFLTTTLWSGKIVNNEPDKCDRLDWFHEDHLPENTIPYIRKALDNYRSQRENNDQSIWFERFGWPWD